MLARDRKAIVKPLQQGFPNHDANLPRAVSVRSVRALDLISINATAAECFKLAGIDLMYGLPKQTVGDVIRSAEAAASLGPSRIALFGYAHVPWFKPHQKLIDIGDRRAERPPLRAPGRGRLRCLSAAEQQTSLGRGVSVEAWFLPRSKM
jgi:hypothetical protein